MRLKKLYLLFIYTVQGVYFLLRNPNQVGFEDYECGEVTWVEQSKYES